MTNPVDPQDETQIMPGEAPTPPPPPNDGLHRTAWVMTYASVVGAMAAAEKDLDKAALIAGDWADRGLEELAKRFPSR